MFPVRIYVAPDEVDERLASFGVTRAEFFPIIEQVAAARADTISVDAAMAPGMQAYLTGVRHMRLLFLAKGYELDRTNNIESVVHTETKIKIVYQNVDLACSATYEPQAPSGKGPATDKMVDEAQGKLFDSLPVSMAPGKSKLNKTVWFLCVSVIGEDITAELSQPASIENNNFSGFLERIFLVNPGDWKPREVEQPIQDPDEYDFIISRK